VLKLTFDLHISVNVHTCWVDRVQPKSALRLESRGMGEARLGFCGGHDNHDYIGGFK